MWPLGSRRMVIREYYIQAMSEPTQKKTFESQTHMLITGTVKHDILVTGKYSEFVAL